MYSINGAFGKVRLCRESITGYDFPLPYKLTTGGWHRCNDKYVIRRKKGMDVYVLLFNISAGGIARIRDQKWHMKADSFILLPPGVSHEYYVDTGMEWEFYWLCATGPSLDALLSQVIQKYGYYHENMNLKQIVERYETIFPERFLNIPEVYDIRVSGVIADILHDLLLKLRRQAHNQNHSGMVNQILQEIELNYGVRFNVNEWAQKHGISVPYLTRIFKGETGYTPYEYLKKYRLTKAGELLAYSQKSIHQIAGEVGFSSTSNFISQFHKEKGMSPTVYRRTMKKERAGDQEQKTAYERQISGHAVSPVIEKALAYLEKNFREPLSINDVASHCGISVSYFSKIFKKETGVTFTRYLNHCRLQKAAASLHSSQSSILEVALACGFQNFSYFIKMFRQEFGMTPGEYRKTDEAAMLK